MVFLKPTQFQGVSVWEAETNYKKKKEEATKTTKDKMMACLFLAGIDKSKYGRCLDELTNSSRGGSSDKYTTTLREAVDYVSEYADSSKGKDGNKGILMMQQHVDKTCYTCGGTFVLQLSKEQEG